MCGFAARNMDTVLSISKTVICVVFMDDCLFWARSQYDIDNIMNYFKEGGTS